MHRALIAIVLFAAQTTALAATSFWVSVASFQDPIVAERAMNEAAAALHEPLVIQRAETPNGVYQRVAMGPFLSRDAALTALDLAKANGYPDSWVFTVADPAAPAESTVISAEDSSELEQVLNDDATGSYTSADLDAMEQELILSQPAQRPDLVEPKLPTEIPPGYRLNSLFRDGGGITKDQ
jgi:SPOR domain